MVAFAAVRRTVFRNRQARIACSIPALAAMLAPAAALAQDGDPLITFDPRGAITVTATRVPQPIIDVPAT